MHNNTHDIILLKSRKKALVQTLAAIRRVARYEVVEDVMKMLISLCM